MTIQNKPKQSLYEVITYFFLSHKKVVVEKSLISVGVVLFRIHLLLYAAKQYDLLPFALPPTYFSHPLNTLYTPFSFILIAEVYLLIYYLPTSFTRSLVKQLEIVCLIEIRSVFKYV